MSYSIKHSSTFCNEVEKINNKAGKGLRGGSVTKVHVFVIPQRLKEEEERIEGGGEVREVSGRGGGIESTEV